MHPNIQKIINEAVRSDTKKEIKSWHPSKLGSCLTGAYLERSGVEPEEQFDERTLRVFSAGKHFESWLIERIKESGAEVEEQVRIKWPEMDVTGYADLTINGFPYEIKSKHSRSFWYMEKKKEGANHHHKMQLWTYLKVLHKERGHLVYVSKDDLSILEYPVFLNDTELEKEVMGELIMLNRAWKEQLPPPVMFGNDDWRAKYCRWHKQCTTQSKYLDL